MQCREKFTSGERSLMTLRRAKGNKIQTWQAHTCDNITDIVAKGVTNIL